MHYRRGAPPSQPKPAVAKAGPPQVRAPSKPAPRVGEKEEQFDDTKGIEIVQDSPVCITEWYLRTSKLQVGAPIPITVTVANTTFDDFNEPLMIRVDKDNFFNLTAHIWNKEKRITIPAADSCSFDVDLNVQNVTSLQDLPERKELKLVRSVNSKMLQVGKLDIQIPIDPYLRFIKEEFRNLKALLWGKFGSGKSSFINSLATLFNEDSRFPNAKLTPAYVRPAGSSVTLKLESYTFNNVTLVDTWGWEHQNPKLYSDLVFQAMLGGNLQEGFTMGAAAEVKLSNLRREGEKVDVALFLITYDSVDDEAYLGKLHEFINIARNEDIPPLVLLTQIDKVEPSLRENPYAANPDIKKLVQRVCVKCDLDDALVLPVVNYTSETERTWQMDRAAFVTVYRCFQRREEATKLPTERKEK